VVQSSIPIPGRALGIRGKNTRILNLRVLEVAVVILVLAICATRARADAALLMEEPYGEFGRYNPMGKHHRKVKSWLLWT
jgi:hypothetical protein